MFKFIREMTRAELVAFTIIYGTIICIMSWSVYETATRIPPFAWFLASLAP